MMEWAKDSRNYGRVAADYVHRQRMRSFAEMGGVIGDDLASEEEQRYAEHMEKCCK